MKSSATIDTLPSDKESHLSARLMGGAALVAPDVAATALAPLSLQAEHEQREQFNSLVTIELYDSPPAHILRLEEYTVPRDTTYHQPPTYLEVYSDWARRREDLVYRGSKKTTHHMDEEAIGRMGETGYRERIRGDIIRFLSETDRGRLICRAYEFTPDELDTLPVQTVVKLLGSVIHTITNYNHADTKRRLGGTVADNINSAQIIERGIDAHSKKQDVSPLGVCRNFADVEVAIFEALKVANPYLRNTYAFGSTAFDGPAVGELRNKRHGERGHAWVDFITVLQDGSTAITTVDPTWATEVDGEMQRYDCTKTRVGGHLHNLALYCRYNYSRLKQKNMQAITDAYQARNDEIMVALKKKHAVEPGRGLNMPLIIDDPLVRKAMYNAVDYRVLAAQYGGSSFISTPEVLLKWIVLAARDEDIVFTEDEFTAVISGLEESKKIKLFEHRAAEVDQLAAGVKARHERNMQDPSYATFAVNGRNLGAYTSYRKY